MSSASIVTTSATDAHVGDSSLRARKAPLSVIGMTFGMITGMRPRKVWYSGRPRMPQSTDVGQSGPPHMMHTLAMLMPRCSRMYRIVRISSELIATAARTPTLLAPQHSPMSFCCITWAIILMM